MTHDITPSVSSNIIFCFLFPIDGKSASVPVSATTAGGSEHTGPQNRSNDLPARVQNPGMEGGQSAYLGKPNTDSPPGIPWPTPTDTEPPHAFLPYRPPRFPFDTLGTGIYRSGQAIPQSVLPLAAATGSHFPAGSPVPFRNHRSRLRYRRTACQLVHISSRCICGRFFGMYSQHRGQSDA